MQPVLDYLNENQERFVQELCDYVRFPSVSAQPKHKPDLEACAQWLQKHCEGLGLETRLCPTAGNPIVLAKTPRQGGTRRPHFMVYGHYDVQPPEPFELWKSPPFEPRIEGRNLFARGATDNKGQHLAHLNAVEAYLKTGTELPCDLTFVIEGEEEVGSSHLAEFLKSNLEELACDGIIISDNGIPSLKHPALTYALRGILAVEVILHGPSRDLHSGIYGGSVDNPAMALSQLLARLRDKNGRIAIPGFYDNVQPLSSYERKQLARLPYNESAFRKFMGVPKLFGEKGYTSVEQRCARPTIEINGLTSGYQGEGSKTIVPSWARAKLTFRLVPNQKPQKIQKAVVAQLQRLCPPTVRMEIKSGHGGEPYIVSPTGPHAQAALRALKQAFGHEPVLMREGGSIPIVNDFKKYLKAETLLLGLALPDDNAHSPNEKFNLDCFEKGMRMGALLWQELAAVQQPAPKRK
ncbi:MAG TPA: dipeptidase [Candidatus Saccharimonadales bacterium]|nr:dipeptidase [Candidatus Saccharimonadales bacterium]